MREWFFAYWRDLLSAFGALASVVGAFLTVKFSARAMSAAEAASKATSETKVRIANVDLFSAIKDLVAHVREIAFRIEEGSVDLAREKVSDAVNSAIEVIEHWDSVLTEEKANLLAIFIVQMKELNAQLISFRGARVALKFLMCYPCYQLNASR